MDLTDSYDHSDEPAPKQQGGGRDRRPQQRGGQQRGGQQRNSPPPANGSMADALRKAGFGK